MRKTLRIDDAVLTSAKAIAEADGRNRDGVASSDARFALTRPGSTFERNGILLLQRQGVAAGVNLDRVNALRDEALFPID